MTFYVFYVELPWFEFPDWPNDSKREKKWQLRSWQIIKAEQTCTKSTFKKIHTFVDYSIFFSVFHVLFIQSRTWFINFQSIEISKAWKSQFCLKSLIQAVSLVANRWIVHTFVSCSWWPLGSTWRSTFGRSTCWRWSFGPTVSNLARWHHLGVGGPSEGWTPSGCCSRTRFVRLRVVYRRRSIVADLAGFLPCLEFWIWRSR